MTDPVRGRPAAEVLAELKARGRSDPPPEPPHQRYDPTGREEPDAVAVLHRLYLAQGPYDVFDAVRRAIPELRAAAYDCDWEIRHADPTLDPDGRRKPLWLGATLRFGSHVGRARGR